MAHYRAIAEALRRRITTGELRPGDTVPSTRALAREWGVAAATAAHALHALAAEGWVVAEHRTGTVVAPRPAAPAAPRARDGELGRERIVRAAMEIADREGIGALTLRAVASRVEAPVMSLYRHVDGKDELIRDLIDAALGEEELPAQPHGWRDRLSLAARLQWRVFRRHPWLARAMSISRPAPMPGAVRVAEWVLSALEGHGLGAAERMRMHVVLFGFVQGMAVNLETEVEAASESGLTDDQWMAGQLRAFDALARSGRYPAFARVMDELDETFELDFDALFEIGLAALLDGYAVRLGAAR